jgi:hypothetical protein
MANKYIAIISGIRKLVEGLVTSSGAGDAGKLVALDGSGRLDASVMPVGVGADTKTIEASENLSAGNLVNVWNDGGTQKVRKADAGNKYAANGFVLSSVTSGQDASVYLEGTITGLTSKTPGARQYLSDTAGELTETPVTASGAYHQFVGTAVSDTEVSFEPDDVVEMA